jgi:ubiquinone/menaquinone biosynthesis C-methylase UbiE
MTAEERVALIRGAVDGTRGTWADLGSGEGAFSSALASLLGPGSRIYAVEREGRSLRAQDRAFREGFPECTFELVHADFTAELPLPPLDGILMANALHFQADHCRVLAHVSRWLKTGGMLVLVEYDIHTANPWVPHPVPASRISAVCECAGLTGCRILASMPSRFHRRMYAAVCVKGRQRATLR